jgi:hypothetical protein
MISRNKIWMAAGAFMIVAMLSLSICINACTDIAPASNDCPHHRQSSDCCKHPSDDSASLGWKSTKQHWIATPIVPAIASQEFAAPQRVGISEFVSLDKFNESSGPPNLRSFSLRI